MPSSKEIRAGRGNVELGVKDKSGKGLDHFENRISTRMKRFGRRLKNVGLGVGAAGTALMTPLIGASKLFMDVGASISKISKQTGHSVEGVSQLVSVSKSLGIETDDIVGATEELNLRLGEAVADNTGPLADMFKKLGIDAAAMKELPITEQYAQLAETIAGIEDPSFRQFAADEIFGGDAFKIMELLDQGANLRGKLAAAPIMSKEDIENAVKMKRATDAMWAGFMRIVTTVGAALAPVLTEAADFLTGIAKTVQEWAGNNKTLVKWIFGIGSALVAVGGILVGVGVFASVVAAGIGGIATVASGVIAVVGGIASAIAAAAAVVAVPLAIAAAVVGIGAAALHALGLLGGLWAGAKRFFGEILGIAKQTFGGIVDALMSGNLSMAAQIAWQGIKAAALTALVAIQNGWFAFTDRLASVWAEVTAAMKIGWASFNHWLVDKFFKALAKINSWVASNFGMDLLGKANLNKALAGNDALRDRAEANAARQVSDAHDARREARGETWLDRSLRATNADLGRLTKEAADARAAANEAATDDSEDGDNNTPFSYDPSDFNAGLGGAEATARQAKGSFSAAGAQALLAGSTPTARQLKAAEKTAAHVEEIARLARESELVFT